MKKKQGISRTLGLGMVALAAGLLSARAVTQPFNVEETPSPVDQLLEVAASAPEVDVMHWVEDGRWDMPVTYNDRVGFWIDFLKGRNAEKTALWLERLGRYGPMIQQELRSRDMPTDLVYLAMIESGLSPVAYSHAHAAGMWQFIEETGERYGLDVNAYVDERRDPIRATSAALDYLSELHDRFGSWYLAAASYNTGENRVGRIMREHFGREQGENGAFWRIDEDLPRETRDYVPLMLAAGHIGKDPEKYGFTHIELQDPLRYDEVVVPGGVPLSTVAVAAGTSETAVRDLNPHLIRGMTPPGREGYPVRIPPGHERTFAQNFERVISEQATTLAMHRVGRGETLSHIARDYGVSVDELRALNAGVDPRRLQVGDRIQVPVAGGEVAPDSEEEWLTYRVRQGDSLWTIARRHGVEIDEIQAWNGLGSRSRIIPGQTLKIRA
ncbi:MAG: LysM peptidoglycan-binding domain-containing protein [Longimicrobiales bacterium]